MIARVLYVIVSFCMDIKQDVDVDVFEMIEILVRWWVAIRLHFKYQDEDISCFCLLDLISLYTAKWFQDISECF